jgi:peroxiredoxin Q/BCP
MRDFEALGAAVCGVSVDGSDRQAEFARKQQLPFTLLSDRDGAVASRYGSIRNLGFMKFAKRNVFLIDPRGQVAAAYLGANPAENAGDILSDLRRLAKP